MATARQTAQPTGGMVITIVSGKQSFNDSSTSVAALYKVPNSKKMLYANTKLKEQGKPVFTNAAKDGGQNNGKWVTQSFYPEDGDILCFHLNATYKGMVSKQAQILIRCSPIGHVYTIEAKPIFDSRAAFKEITIFQGRGHLLSLNMAKQLHLIGLIPSMYEDSAVDDAFNITRVSAGQELVVERIPARQGIASQNVLVPEARKRRVRVI